MSSGVSAVSAPSRSSRFTKSVPQDRTVHSGGRCTLVSTLETCLEFCFAISFAIMPKPRRSTLETAGRSSYQELKQPTLFTTKCRLPHL